MELQSDRVSDGAGRKDTKTAENTVRCAKDVGAELGVDLWPNRFCSGAGRNDTKTAQHTVRCAKNVGAELGAELVQWAF